MNFAEITNKLFGGSQRTATVKKNIWGSLAMKVISMSTSFLLVPMTIGYVSAEIYGLWLTISSILYWIAYFDVGITHGLKNRLNECLARKDYAKGKSLVSTTYAIMFAIFVPLSALLICITPLIDWCGILNVTPSYQEILIKTIRTLFIFIALQMIIGVFGTVVSAYQKTALSSLFSVLGQISALCIISLMTHFVEPSLLNLVFAYSIMPIVIVFTASIIFFKTSMKEVAPSIKAINKAYIKDLWGLGFKFFIIQIQMIVLFQSTNMLISHIAGPESVTQYNIAYKLLNVVVMVYTIILNPLWPAFTDAYTRKDYAWMNNTYNKMKKIFLFLCLMLSAIVIFSPFLIKLWIGDKVSVPFVLTLSIAIYTLIHCWDSLQVILINGTGKVKLQSYVVIIGLVLHIPLSLFLGKYIGIIGVMVSMSIINIIYACFFTTQIRKILSNTATGIWNE
jgi:O-antigen/teichoic acid export membrane protein